jgi:hypothetical protein
MLKGQLAIAIGVALCLFRDSIALCIVARLYALASAALFGVSTPAAKVLLGTITPRACGAPLW